MTQYYSTAQVAAMFSLDVETIRRYWRRGWFTPTHRTPTKIANRILISDEDIQWFLSTEAAA